MCFFFFNKTQVFASPVDSCHLPRLEQNIILPIWFATTSASTMMDPEANTVKSTQEAMSESGTGQSNAKGLKRAEDMTYP